MIPLLKQIKSASAGNNMDKCQYCDRDERFKSLFFEVCELTVSTVFLCKDQTLPGRCTIMYKDHINELYQIPEDKREQYIKDICALEEALMEIFHPDKLNMAYYGDKCNHVHFTICPKYEDKLGWGEAFFTFPPEEERVFLTDAQYKQRIEQIKSIVLEKRLCSG